MERRAGIERRALVGEESRVWREEQGLKGRAGVGEKSRGWSGEQGEH